MTVMTFRAALLKRASPWLASSVVWAVVTTVGVCTLFELAKPLKTEKVSGATAPPPSVAAVLPYSSPAVGASHRILNEELVPPAAVQTLNADMQHLEELQKQERVLLGSMHPRTPSSDNRPLLTEPEERKKLVSALILLLKLERRNEGETPQIVAVRRNITQLQSELRRSPIRNLTSPALNPLANSMRRDELHAQVARAEADVVTDQRAVVDYQLSIQQRKEALRGNVEDQTSSIKVPLPKPSEDATSRQLGISRILTRGLTWIICSIFLGLISGAIFFIWMSRPAVSICSEATLRTAFAGRAIYIGHIPRMKV